MIRSGKVKETPSKRIRERSAKMKAELYQLYDDFENVVQIRVEPDVEGKAVRIVEFKKIEGDIEVRCWNEESLVLCEGNRFGVYCSHAHCAYEFLMTLHGEKHRKKQLRAHDSQGGES